MWTTLALLGTLTLAPAQAGEPEFKNARFTYGILGPDAQGATSSCPATSSAWSSTSRG